ncbi:LOW QUALITY PROTEIN: hypothetical protein CFOL_v3_05829, partial [Cephalotus follicularis]
LGGLCKGRSLLRESQVARLAEALTIGEMVSKRYLNQEISLKRPGDTCWSSHYGTLINLIILFSSASDVIKIIVEDELRFNEVNTGLLLCMASLNPRDSFSAFDKKKLIRFAQFYASDFIFEIEVRDSQLDTYIINMCSCDECSELKGIGDFVKKLVKLKKDILYTFVFKVVSFTLILPVTTVAVEMVFSKINI